MSVAREAEGGIVRYLDALEDARIPPPGDTLEMIAFRPGMSAAVIDNGTLFPSIQAAAGDAGRVLMLQHDSNLVERMRQLSDGGRRFDLVVAVNLADWVTVLGEVTRILEEHGRLIVIECTQSAGPNTPALVTFHEMVQLLEKNSWTVHRHGATGLHRYLLEATVTDQSVQS